MKSKMVGGAGSATYVVVLDEGEEAFSELSAFASREGITAGQVTAVGGFSRAVVGWFDREARGYRRIEVGEQCEVLSLLGDIALAAEGPQPHLHTVLGLRDGTTRGGHLLQGHVWPTAEVIIQEAPTELRKIHRPELGLALIDLDRS